MLDVDTPITIEENMQTTAQDTIAHEAIHASNVTQLEPIRFDKPNIFICGPSGSGKSSSLRNLDPERTIILNTERKQLPFKAARKFKKHRHINNFTEFEKTLKAALKAKDVDVVVIESFTSLAEMGYQEIIRPIERTGDKVMQAWQQYKDRMHDVLLQAKQADRYVVWTGIDEITQDEKSAMYRTVSVQGGLKGKVEKEFEIVLWTKIVNGDEGPEYTFVTNSDGINKAKSPMQMFDEQYIDNDLKQVIDSIYTYYTEE